MADVKIVNMKLDPTLVRRVDDYVAANGLNRTALTAQLWLALCEGRLYIEAVEGEAPLVPPENNAAAIPAGSEWTPQERADVMRRMFEHVSWRPPACSIWAGQYPRLSFRNVSVPVNRLSYALRRGPVPAGSKVIRTCSTPGCVTSEHLELDLPGETSGAAVLAFPASHDPAARDTAVARLYHLNAGNPGKEP